MFETDIDQKVCPSCKRVFTRKRVSSIKPSVEKKIYANHRKQVIRMMNAEHIISALKSVPKALKKIHQHAIMCRGGKS
jgi:transposase-like protein